MNQMTTDTHHREFGAFLPWRSFDLPVVPVSHPWGDDCVLFGSGVDAFRGLLEHGRSTRGWQRLWAPSYFCQEVMRSLLIAGLQVLLYDYGPEDTCPLGARIGAKPGDVVLRMNFFGLHDRLSTDGIDRNRVEILDDHTHDPWSDWAYTSDADWCVVSPRKTLPLPGGGVLWSPRRHPLPTPSPVTETRRAATFEKFTAMVLKGLYLQGYPLDREIYWRLNDAAEDHMASGEVSGLPEWIGDLLKCFPAREWREHRRNNCLAVSNVLKGLPWLKVLEANGGGGSCQFSGVVLFDSEERRNFVRQQLADRRIFLTVLWELDDAPIPEIPEEHRRFSKTLLCIPCDARYDRAAVEKVSGLIRDIGNRFASSGRAALNNASSEDQQPLARPAGASSP
jgi:hypothetical protein